MSNDDKLEVLLQEFARTNEQAEAATHQAAGLLATFYHEAVSQGIPPDIAAALTVNYMNLLFNRPQGGE
jgi:hypothetical protein